MVFVESSNAWQIAEAIQRIWAGERDEEALTADISYNSRAIVRAILAQLAGAVPSVPSEAQGSEAEGESTAQAPGGSQPPGGSEAAQAITRIRQQWAPVIRDMVAACQGDAEAAAQLAPLFDQLSGQNDWRDLVAVLRRVLAGERDPDALLPGLDATDTLIAADVLRALGVEVDPPPPAGEGPGEGAESLTLDDLLDLVARACCRDAPPGLGEQLHAATRTMVTDTDAPPELRALGSVLNRVLSGERDPDLSALPSELADRVRAMLATLG